MLLATNEPGIARRTAKEQNMASTLPYILRETSSGIHSYRIQDEMLRRREIQCTGPIDDSAADDLCLQLRYLQQADPTGEITIYINSPGGSVLSGLAIYDVMKAISCPVRTVCLGMAASMAALLFISGDRRDMLPHSQVMIHDPILASPAGGSALEMKALSDNLMRVREITGQVIAEHTGKTLDEVLATTSHDSYFEAAQAVEFGLADRVITTL